MLLDDLEDAVANETLENLSHEDRRFPPSEEFAAQANGRADCTPRPTPTARASGPSRPAALTWATDFTQTLDWSDAPFAKWFVGGRAQRRRTTASTGTSRPATATGSRSTSRASPATPAPSPTPSCSARSAGPPTR